MKSIENRLKKTPLGFHWEQIGIHSHNGINLPLSALHSKHSCGIGEFYDLIPLINWCHELKIDTIQLLPLNDSGFDPSPYNAVSSIALHPIYLSLDKLPNIQCHKDLLSKIKELKELNALPRVDFYNVLIKKLDFLSLYFEKEKTQIISSKEFSTYISENSWLKSYSLFKVLREKNNNTHFSLWPEDHFNLSKDDFEALFLNLLDDCSFHIVLQYLCFLQLSHVKKKANSKKIYLKGDIPILISPDSADIWFEPELFDLSLSIGSPPDMYNEKGQYWGFPRPKIDLMRENGFTWWKNKLQYANNFYDIYRIDHAVGLFRLWAIETGRESIEGHFEPIDPTTWKPLGRELLLMLIESSTMLPIAEDLGCDVQLIRPILEEMGICGTNLIRWEKDAHNKYIDPKDYSPISLTCVSTHDSPTLEQWWNEDTEEAKAYAIEHGLEYKPPITQKQRKYILKQTLKARSLFRISLFSEYLALVPDLVNPDPDLERINVPGMILPTNWTYKFRCSIEKITTHAFFKKEMEDLFL
jgi:4-alpha-glucanotransferase